MVQLRTSDSAADYRVQDPPFADERDRYLSHCAAHGARPAVLKVKRNELLWIARRLGPDVSPAARISWNSSALNFALARGVGSAGDPATAMPDPINHAVVLGPIKAKPFGSPREVRGQP
jgi:hypothetical protein